MSNEEKKVLEEVKKELEEEFLDKVLIQRRGLSVELAKVFIIVQKYSNILNQVANSIYKETNFECEYFQIIEYNQDTLQLKLYDQVLEVNKLNLYLACANIVNFFEKIYPIGTIIRLETGKKDDKISGLFMIQNTMLVNAEDKSFAQYSVVLYPKGEIEKDEYLLISNEIISEVVHCGYESYIDEVNTLNNKYEYIVEHDFKSIDFYLTEDKNGQNN